MLSAIHLKYGTSSSSFIIISSSSILKFFGFCKSRFKNHSCLQSILSKYPHLKAQASNITLHGPAFSIISRGHGQSTSLNIFSLFKNDTFQQRRNHCLLTSSSWKSSYNRCKFHTSAPLKISVKRQFLPKDLRLSGMCSVINNRSYNEDRLQVVHLSPKLSFFACFDGHSGDKAADFCKHNFHVYIEKAANSSKNIFLGGDSSQEREKEVIKNVFQDIHEAFVKEYPGESSGTTATIAILSENQLTIASVGDSRALLYSSGELIFLTQDHKPDLEN
eukprot:Awhi_evm1s8525